MEEIRLTPKEWVEETKKCLIDQNKMLGSKKAIRANDYKYIGMAVIVAEFVKQNIGNRIDYVFKVGTKFRLNKPEDVTIFKCYTAQISTYSLPEGAIWINGGQNRLTMKEFVDGLENGRFELINN
jgi:hypothetical protein